MTCAVHEEGENLALYLTPVSLPRLSRAVGAAPDDLALILPDGADAPRTCRWDALYELELELDLVHLPARTPAHALEGLELPVPLLAAPEEALPAELGSRLALSVQDGCHGVVISRDQELLARCLGTVLDDYLSAVAGEQAAGAPLEGDLLQDLLEPQPPGACLELSFQRRSRYWLLEATGLGDGAGSSGRWVCERGGGRWRAWRWSEVAPASQPI